MIYIVEYEFADDNGGGMFGPYSFDSYEKSLKFFVDAITDELEDIKWKKNRHCYAADLYRVDYHRGKSVVLLKYGEKI